MFLYIRKAQWKNSMFVYIYVCVHVCLCGVGIRESVPVREKENM